MVNFSSESFSHLHPVGQVLEVFCLVLEEAMRVGVLAGEPPLVESLLDVKTAIHGPSQVPGEKDNHQPCRQRTVKTQILQIEYRSTCERAHPFSVSVQAKVETGMIVLGVTAIYSSA